MVLRAITHPASGFTAPPHAQNFPFQGDPACLLDPGSDKLAQAFKIRSARLPAIDEKIAMQFGDLRIANREATAAGLVNQFPRLVPRRVFKSRAAGAGIYGLSGGSRARDLHHLRQDPLAVAKGARKNRLRENHILRDGTMAIGKAHARVGMLNDIALAVDAPAGDENIFCLSPIGPGVHSERAANRPRYAAKKR